MYILVRRTAYGTVTAHDDFGRPETPLFESAQAAGEAVTKVLYDNAAVPKSAAEGYGGNFALQPVGTVYEHDSGYAFRLLVADYTVDGKPIVPGLRVLNTDMQWWGSVFRSQFLSGKPEAPGGESFRGWYEIDVDGRGRRVYDHACLTTNGALLNKPDPSPASTRPVYAEAPQG